MPGTAGCSRSPTCRSLPEIRNNLPLRTNREPAPRSRNHRRRGGAGQLRVAPGSRQVSARDVEPTRRQQLSMTLTGLSGKAGRNPAAKMVGWEYLNARHENRLPGGRRLIKMPHLDDSLEPFDRGVELNPSSLSRAAEGDSSPSTIGTVRDALSSAMRMRPSETPDLVQGCRPRSKPHAVHMRRSSHQLPTRQPLAARSFADVDVRGQGQPPGQCAVLGCIPHRDQPAPRTVSAQLRACASARLRARFRS
jgi:hypothetical protein